MRRGQDVGRAGALTGAATYQSGFLETGRREVEEAAGAGEQLAVGGCEGSGQVSGGSSGRRAGREITLAETMSWSSGSSSAVVAFEGGMMTTGGGPPTATALRASIATRSGETDPAWRTAFTPATTASWGRAAVQTHPHAASTLPVTEPDRQARSQNEAEAIRACEALRITLKNQNRRLVPTAPILLPAPRPW
ncbi:hypothetical protein [Streptomyces tauricus]|uniref:hypothetical protein n=1 Tax=Streptomyces tauricus TaxID=68274 RepID=UPI0033A1C5FC